MFLYTLPEIAELSKKLDSYGPLLRRYFTEQRRQNLEGRAVRAKTEELDRRESDLTRRLAAITWQTDPQEASEIMQALAGIREVKAKLPDLSSPAKPESWSLSAQVDEMQKKVRYLTNYHRSLKSGEIPRLQIEAGRPYVPRVAVGRLGDETETERQARILSESSEASAKHYGPKYEQLEEAHRLVSAIDEFLARYNAICQEVGQA